MSEGKVQRIEKLSIREEKTYVTPKQENGTTQRVHCIGTVTRDDDTVTSIEIETVVSGVVRHLYFDSPEDFKAFRAFLDAFEARVDHRYL